MHIIIFTANLDFNVRWGVITLAERFPDARFTIVQQVAHKPLKRLLRNQVRNLSRHGWRWVPYQGAEIVSLLLGRGRQSPVASPDRPGRMYGSAALASHPRIAVRQFSAINGPEACAFVQSQQADLGIALGAPILKSALFELPRLGTINLHKGKLPDFRGMPPAFWELHAGAASVGCTVHRVAAGLDTGEILLAREVPVDAFSTVAGMQIKLHRVGVELVAEAVAAIVAGTAQFRAQPAGGNTNTRPTLALEARVKAQLAARDPSRGSAPKRLAKHLMFRSYAQLLTPAINYWHGLTGQQRVIILLYHRVSDQFRDNVTIGIERFDQHMAYLAANCQVVSLRQIVEGDIDRHAKKPVIAVSFDDGYLDNFEHAAPILIKHQVPCTFFISTEKIRDNKPFDHDMRALGFGLDNMSWDQVRQMRDWGLHFGSHTRNHVNLAEIDDALAHEELAGSLADIRAELGQEQVYIAFPYGRKKHITPARIETMRELGYGACFSAYGGLNDASMDRFNIRRIGVNWAFDLTTLQARLRGWDKTQ
ncbi:polysaccharide deacetylase family protein [Massilia sp. CF038]|uniref:polysaccharide deacetylase family protein n=1 Tax=Massilia sp. CF038 TaxID=1881045 RepID=UPI000921B864|nr:polysaccharide deacetylase family protein [Massilia sp. CF038]SHH41600.1 Methionyl-tRNA formyltransferase [Massilia sp. CF038]